jgi:hypothetical protein
MATRTVRRACFAATSIIFALSLTWPIDPASADGIRNTTCLSSGGGISCTTQWQRTGGGQVLPWQIDPRETAATAERERRWLARCRPVARQDQFGVSRYSYAAAGCEFGKTED